MFSFSKRFTHSKRSSSSSPYGGGGGGGGRGRGGGCGGDGGDGWGSTVSLPTLLHSYRGFTLQSNTSHHTVDEAISPTTVPPSSSPHLNSRFDPEAPPSIRRQQQQRRQGAERPKTFYRLFGYSTEEGGRVSPVALPHKALALLGIHEVSGFASSPLKDPNDHEEEDEDVPQPPPPERVYFRPESLCSSFSTNSSEKTMATTVTSVGNPEENGTYGSESTVKGGMGGVSMLNLDDSDEEDAEEVKPLQLSQPQTNRFVVARQLSEEEEEGGRRLSAPASELPVEITLQICQYFVTETHREDQPQQCERCPNCDIYTLWSLALVSRSWNKAAVHWLYGTVSLDFGYYCSSSTPADTPEFVPYTRCESGLHTKLDVEAKLQLLYRTIWDSQGDIGERIRGIKLPRRLFSITKYPLSAILQKCPNLEFVDHAVTSGSAEDLVIVLSKLPRMKQWKWMREQGIRQRQTTKSICGPPSAIAMRVFPRWTQLQHLELNNLRRVEIPDEFDFSTALPRLRSVALRNLKIVDRHKDMQEPRFLERLPPLQRLEIDSCLFLGAERILSYIVHSGYRLTHLHLRNTLVPTHMLYQLLANTPEITHLSVTNTNTTTTTTAESTTPEGFAAHLPFLPWLEMATLDMRPLSESFMLLLRLAQEPVKTPRLRRMLLGFEAAGKKLEAQSGGGAMDAAEMRMEVELRTECLYRGVQLSML